MSQVNSEVSREIAQREDPLELSERLVLAVELLGVLVGGQPHTVLTDVGQELLALDAPDVALVQRLDLVSPVPGSVPTP